MLDSDSTPKHNKSKTRPTLRATPRQQDALNTKRNGSTPPRLAKPAPAPPTPQPRLTRAQQEAEHAHRFLSTRWPLAFRAPAVPLKIGIANDVLAATPGVSTLKVRRLLSVYCGSVAYLSALIEDVPRVDLLGRDHGVVDAPGAADAVQRLAALRSERLIGNAAAC
jgi:ProP effector